MVENFLLLRIALSALKTLSKDQKFGSFCGFVVKVLRKLSTYLFWQFVDDSCQE